MSLIPQKLFKRDYLQMLVKDKLAFLRMGTAVVAGHRFSYPHWPYFYGIFYEIFVEDNYRIDGLEGINRIIDAGSNIGVSAAYFALTYPHARIDCFEPNPEALTYLEQNTQGFPGVHIHPYALADTEGVLPFLVDADIKASSIASAADLFTSKRRPSREITVQVQKLSSFIDGPIDILKLDIEGGEMKVMDDLVATGTLRNVKHLLLEFHYVPEVLPASLAQLLTTLEENGFFTYVRRGSMTTVPKRVSHAYMIYGFRDAS